jgi:hypothetical protein
VLLALVAGRRRRRRDTASCAAQGAEACQWRGRGWDALRLLGIERRTVGRMRVQCALPLPDTKSCRQPSRGCGYKWTPARRTLQHHRPSCHGEAPYPAPARHSSARHSLRPPAPDTPWISPDPARPAAVLVSPSAALAAVPRQHGQLGRLHDRHPARAYVLRSASCDAVSSCRLTARSHSQHHPLHHARRRTHAPSRPAAIANAANSGRYS